VTTSDPAIATLEVQIENLTFSISQLNRSVEKNNEKLERLAVLEVSHNNSNAAIERAFTAISKVEASLVAHISSNEREHSGYNKWIWMAVGFCTAVTLLWTVVGYRMNNMIDDMVKSSADMRMHIHDDKVKDHNDLLKFHIDQSTHNGIPKP
jgi:hypothetical protein